MLYLYQISSLGYQPLPLAKPSEPSFYHLGKDIIYQMFDILSYNDIKSFLSINSHIFKLRESLNEIDEIIKFEKKIFDVVRENNYLARLTLGHFNGQLTKEHWNKRLPKDNNPYTFEFNIESKANLYFHIGHKFNPEAVFVMSTLHYIQSCQINISKTWLSKLPARFKTIPLSFQKKIDNQVARVNNLMIDAITFTGFWKPVLDQTCWLFSELFFVRKFDPKTNKWIEVSENLLNLQSVRNYVRTM